MHTQLDIYIHIYLYLYCISHACTRLTARKKFVSKHIHVQIYTYTNRYLYTDTHISILPFTCLYENYSREEFSLEISFLPPKLG
jgi:hypothetical protein